MILCFGRPKREWEQWADQLEVAAQILDDRDDMEEVVIYLLKEAEVAKTRR